MPAAPQRPGLRVVSRANTPALWIRGTVRGRRIFESARTDNPALAEEYRATREAELYRQALHKTPERVSFAAAVLSYLNTTAPSPATRAHLNHLLTHFGARTFCDQLDQVAIDRAADQILRPGYAPATKLRNVVTPALAVLNHAARRKWCAAPQFETLPPGRARTDWFRPEAAERLIDAAAPHVQPLIVFLFCTGARLSEALDLDWHDVDLEFSRATFRDTKNGSDRIVELAPRALAALTGLAGRDGAAFRTQTGLPYADRQRTSGGQIKTAWRSALRRSGIAGDLTPHSCRHTWASWHYCVHRDPIRLRTDGGWRTLALIERYAHLAPPGLAAAIAAFWQADYVARPCPPASPAP